MFLRITKNSSETRQPKHTRQPKRVVILVTLIIALLSSSETVIASDAYDRQISDYAYDEEQAVALARLMWAEARGCSKLEQSMVAWTVLNRIDVGYAGLTDFWSILTAPGQFAYSPDNPYEDYEYYIAVDVLRRWSAEKDGVEDSGRTLPKGYLYYHGDGTHNYFGMHEGDSELWFDLGDPYSYHNSCP